MNRKDRRAGKAHNSQPKAAEADTALRARLSQAAASLNRGEFKAAAAVIQAVLVAHPRLAEAHYLLGNVNLFQEQFRKAAACYRRAIALAPGLAEAHNNLGIAQESQGLMADAAGHYRHAITLRADYAEAHNNLGNALLDLGQAEAAVSAFRAAIASRCARPEACYNNLGNVLAQLGRGEEAAEAYGKAIALQPRFLQALNNLSVLLFELGRSAEAIPLCREAIAVDPTLADGYYNLGNALRECGRLEEAVAAFRQAALLQPEDADTHIALGNVLLRCDQGDEARRLFRHAQRLRPLSKRAGIKAEADFSVLLLLAPGASNTPSDYLVGRAGYDSYFLGVMPDAEYDLDLLRRSGDVVVNLISDVDHGRDILPVALDLVERIGRPTINHPAKIMATGREEIAARLAGLPRCRIPRTIRLSGGALAAPDGDDALAGFSFPLLVRLSGTHGGEAFDKLADAASVAAFVADRPDADYYVTEYVDYRSEDGYFRKYRLIFTDGRILPYHLAIGDQWKVHHFRTDMANQDWMRREEEAFVDDPAGVFDAGHWAALRAIGAAIGLDYFGIDCSLDRDGNIVVFEVNATMLVHRGTSVFSYKEPAIARIKDAFDAMLTKAARPA